MKNLYSIKEIELYAITKNYLNWNELIDSRYRVKLSIAIWERKRGIISGVQERNIFMDAINNGEKNGKKYKE